MGELTINDELVLQADGSIPIPRRPGLGVELNWKAIELFDVKNFDLAKYDSMAKQAAQYAARWSEQTVIAMARTQGREKLPQYCPASDASIRARSRSRSHGK